MMGENAVRLSAISIWSAAASSPCLMIDAVTGSTVALLRSAVWVLMFRVSFGASEVGVRHDERAGLVHDALHAGVEIGGRRLLQDDGRAGELRARPQGVAVDDREVEPRVAGERVRAGPARGDRPACFTRPVGRT